MQCRINQEKVSMDRYNTLKKKKNQLDSKGHVKSRHGQAARNRKQGLTQIPGRDVGEGTQEGRESSCSLSCSRKHTAEMTTRGSSTKAEITILADFLHHHFGKLSVFFFFFFFPLNHPRPWQYYLCRQYQCDRVFSLEASEEI